ncbi:MAG: amino acid permease [Myxococcales bacterium]|nr:amino acid permease [Myxococcales bacterium]
MPEPPALPRRLGTASATLVIVASMIGTGVFTTTGFLVRDLASPGAILAGWLLGGALALAGALCYAELSTALPDNGGEFLLLSRIYHPAVGFVAGFVSLVVGFAAPAAAAAMACGRYLAVLWPALPQTGFAIALIAALGLVHALRVSTGSRLQNAVTAAQVALIVLFVVAALGASDGGQLAARTEVPFFSALMSPELAVGLIYISFSYSGWNAAVYLVGEIEEPARRLVRASALGVVLTTCLYLALNFVFLISAPAAELAGKVEVAAVAAQALLGNGARGFIVAVIGLGLFTSVSALIMTGPRVYEAMGQQHARLRLLDRRVAGGGPCPAIALQCGLSVLMILGADVDALLSYCGLTLSLSAGLTALGVIVLRQREPGLARPYKTWGYPLTPLCYGALTLWMVVHSVTGRPASALAALATLGCGLLLYALVGSPQSTAAR